MSAASPELCARALACVPGWDPALQGLECVALAGGTTNRVYRVRTPAGEFALRLHDLRSSALGVNRGSELALHEAAASAGIAPPIVAVDPAGEFLITRYLRASPWRAQDLADADHLRRLGLTLQELHALPPPPTDAYEPARLLKRHAARLSGQQSAQAAQLARYLKHAEAILARCAGEGRQPAIIHNDLHHSNILQAGRLQLIDFEYAAVADPLFDLACLLAYYPAAAQHAELLLDAAGLPSRALGQLLEASWVYVLLSYLWYRVLALENSPGAAAEAQELWHRLSEAPEQRLRG